MPSAIFCHAAVDAGPALELARVLELNCSLTISGDEGCLASGEDVLDAAERALSVDYLFLLLSPESVPEEWPRNRWESILVNEARKFGTQVIYVLLRACKFPAVFRKGTFFDLSADCRMGRLALRRWLLRQDEGLGPFSMEIPPVQAPANVSSAELDELGSILLDRPGVQTSVDRDLALAFAHVHSSDFQGVFWLNCAHRSRAAILGDIAHALGLNLRGTLDQTTTAIQSFCAARRLLFVFEHASPSCPVLIGPKGKSSIVYVTPHVCPAPRSLDEIAAILSRWRSDGDACLRVLGDVQNHLRKVPACNGESWPIVLSLASAAYSLAQNAGRLAEAYEILELIICALHAKNDPLAAAKWEWEKDWILEEWGEPLPRRPRRFPPNEPAQLDLAFGE